MAPRILPAELRRRSVLRFPRLPLAARSFAEAGRRGDAAFFESFYAAPDPYRLATSERELAKFDALLEACGEGPFERAFEAGCSVGVFTAKLAPRCGDLLAVDIAENALRQAREHCRGLPQVRLERCTLPRELPAGPFDLAVASDILYYFTDPQLRLFAESLPSLLAPGGRFVHLAWLGPVDAVGSGASVSAFLRDHLALTHVATTKAAKSLIDVFEAA